jgi:hypothetical protein
VQRKRPVTRLSRGPYPFPFRLSCNIRCVFIALRLNCRVNLPISLSATLRRTHVSLAADTLAQESLRNR